jgi:hypothetical protein
MTISRTSFLFKPKDGERILPEALGYMRARAKRRAYDMVIREFKKSGIKKAELARRLGIGADRVSRMLGGPGNWTISTVSDLLFAICAGQPKWEFDLPFEKGRRNDTRPEWLEKWDDLGLRRAVRTIQGRSPLNPPMLNEVSGATPPSSKAENIFGLGSQ